MTTLSSPARLFVLLLSLLIATPALAHKVSVFAYVEDGQLFVEGYFADGKKAMNSDVAVYDDSGALLFEGKTDDQGVLIFPVPATGSDLRISLNAGGGHKGEYVIPADELGSAPPAGVQGMEMPGQGSAPAAAAEGDGMDHTHAMAGAVDQAELERLIQHAVADAIKPLVRELAASREHASFTDKVAGIGYIFGILGIFAYLSARAKERKRADGQG